ncbi:MAG: Smr/MutS family protein [Planctomycetes bacterium]|nr:Smr/MutS family protein [Planctomycetota bacterium]
MSRRPARKTAVNRYAGLSRPQASLDFHGGGPITPQEVKRRTIDFVNDCKERGLHRIAIITGKGLHSKGRPVVKPQVERTLRQLERDEIIRMFTVERLDAGGDGAILVDL